MSSDLSSELTAFANTTAASIGIWTDDLRQIRGQPAYKAGINSIAPNLYHMLSELCQNIIKEVNYQIDSGIVDVTIEQQQVVNSYIYLATILPMEPFTNLKKLEKILHIIASLKNYVCMSKQDNITLCTSLDSIYTFCNI